MGASRDHPRDRRAPSDPTQGRVACSSGSSRRALKKVTQDTVRIVRPSRPRVRIACAFCVQGHGPIVIRKRIDVPPAIRSPVTGMAVLITVSENLRASLGNGADDFVDLLQKFGEATKGEVIEASRETFEKALLQTKADLQASIGQLELRMETKLGDIRAEMGQLEGRLEAKIAGTEGRLEAKIAQSHASLIRWMFAMWISQAAFMFGLLMAFLRK